MLCCVRPYFVIKVSAERGKNLPSIYFFFFLKRMPGHTWRRSADPKPPRSEFSGKTAPAGRPWPICGSHVLVSNGNGGGQRTSAKAAEAWPGTLSLPAATWHRPKAQSSIMQTWPPKPEQGRDSSIPQRASFRRQILRPVGDASLRPS